MRRKAKAAGWFYRVPLALVLSAVLLTSLTGPIANADQLSSGTTSGDVEAPGAEQEEESIVAPSDGEGDLGVETPSEDSEANEAAEARESDGVPAEDAGAASEADVKAATQEETAEAMAESTEMSLLATRAVTTFADFRTAVLDLTVDTIVLGGNVVITAQIIIPPTKASLTIDGQGQYTLEQSGPGTALYSAAAINANYTLQNMTFVGRDYYGVVACAASSLCPTIHIDNVVYSGPQMIYNPYGAVIYTGINDILIQANATNSNAAQEVAEIHSVSISGTFNLRYAAPGSSCFWMYGGVGSPSFTIEEGASATITALNKMSSRGFFWISAYVDFTVADNASLTMNLTGDNPFCTDTGHRLQSFSVGSNASVAINCAGGIMVQGTLSVQQGASVLLNYAGTAGSTNSAYAYPLIAFYGSANTTAMSVDRPKALVLAVQPTARPIFYFNNAAAMSFTTTEFNYWNNYAEAAANAKSTSMWYSGSKDAFTAAFSMNAGNDSLKALSASDAAFASSFKPANARVIQVGTDAMPLSVDQIWDFAGQATGTTVANAAVYLDYAGTDHVNHSYSATSDAAGAFAVDLSAGSLSSGIVPSLVSVSGFTATQAFVSVLDSGAPTADPVRQAVEKGSAFTTDGLSLLANVVSDGGSAVSATIKQAPDTSVVGMTSALVTLANVAGKSVQITVPVFVYDEYTSFNEDKTLALRAENFTVYADDFPETGLEGFILEQTKAQAWNLVTGEDISAQVDVPANALEKIFDTQTVTLSVEALSRTVLVTVIDKAAWINVRIPSSMLFGTLDVYNAGTVVSPRYEIENLSDHDVSIGLGGFGVTKSDGISLLKSGNGVYGTDQLHLSLNLDGAVAVDYLQPYTNATQKTPLKTLGAGDASIVTFSGTYYGMFPPITPLKPQYILVWSFEAETGE